MEKVQSERDRQILGQVLSSVTDRLVHLEQGDGHGLLFSHF